MIDKASKPTHSRDHEVLSIDDEGVDEFVLVTQYTRTLNRAMSCVGSQFRPNPSRSLSLKVICKLI
jgi:hypothetical protein